MKILRQSLIDYEFVLLKAIADFRSIPLTASSQAEAIEQIVQALLSPVATAITLDDLSNTEQEAIDFLLKNGGKIEGPRFARQYGVIRAMGPARLEREQPWQNPINPAEGLWYRGLIFKAFQVTGQGGQEIVYIPNDLLPLLKPDASKIQSTKLLQIALAPTPAVIISGTGRLRENFFSLLVYLQTTPVRVGTIDKLPVTVKQNLIETLLPAFTPAFTAEAELEFLLHLGLRSGLLTIAHNRLRPDRDAIRNWLQAEPGSQLQQLQNSWRADPTWNDLWHVPGLVPQATGWENSPLRARSKILGYLEQMTAPVGEWLSIESFTSTIKRVDPDFQRPNGDYDSWYIQNSTGDFLMGFEHWDNVEGQLIKYFLTTILPVLGAVDLGYVTENDEPTAFCLTKVGEAFLMEQTLTTPQSNKSIYLRIDNNFRVRVPAKASLYDRFQLARFATLEHREKHRVIYQISRATISRAIKNGVTADQIIAFLTRATNNQVPLKILETVRTWSKRYASLKLEQATILRFTNEQVALELRKNPAIHHLLGESLGPSTIFIAAEHVSELRRLLVEMGYLE